MNPTRANNPGRRGLVAALALTSLAVPVAVVVPAVASSAPAGSLAGASHYGLTVLGLVIGLTSALGTLVFNRALAPAWLRWLAVGMASLGALFAAYLLFTLIGTCGLGVLGGACVP